MGKIVNYGKKRIALDYTSQSLSESDLKNSVNIEAKGWGKAENYDLAEEEAQFYLIMNALSKKPRKNRLNKIVGIMQDIVYDGLEQRIILKGVPVFE